jgi:hypothetical protein
MVYWHDWPNTLNELAKYRAPRLKAGAYDVRKMARGLDRGLDDGRVARFLRAVWKKPKLSMAEGTHDHERVHGRDLRSRSARPQRLSRAVQPRDRRADPERWKHWRANDPVNLVAKHAASLRSLHGIYIDCGWRDQYHIHYGTRILSRRLREARIEHAYQEFDDNHSDVDYRMDVSLPFLSKTLTP